MSFNHIFNTDLYVQDFVEKNFPNISSLFYDTDICTYFDSYEKPANTQKKNSQKWGIIALILGLYSLLAASAYHHYECSDFKNWIAISAALSGILSVPIGLRILCGNPKREWLYARLLTERTRQFHFQCILGHLTNAISQPTEYLKQKQQCFEKFKYEFNQRHIDGKFSSLISTNKTNPWLVDIPTPDFDNLSSAQQERINDIFNAYQIIRIEHQIDYTDHMLRTEWDQLLPPPKVQKSIINIIIFFSIAFLLLIHFSISIGVIGTFDYINNPYLHTATIWFAIFGLVARAFEEGWQSEATISRYEWYKTSLENIREDYVRHGVTASERFALMKEVEKLAFEEMCEFLRTSNRSKFIL